jgi:hypothetical protein
MFNPFDLEDRKYRARARRWNRALITAGIVALVAGIAVVAFILANPVVLN